ncbi:hypothetical protein B566_EDAN016103 [Ephemera danica]|nr:hypothetical protein B566_EDAN016103 [Ephemera danica]
MIFHLAISDFFTGVLHYVHYADSCCFIIIEDNEAQVASDTNVSDEAVSEQVDVEPEAERPVLIPECFQTMATSRFGYNKQGEMLGRSKNSAVPSVRNVGNTWSHTDIASQSPLHLQDQILDTTDDMDSFYSRCLLCTCRPDATPHVKIFSDAGNELKLAEKLNIYLNIQIEPELPQRVCQSCLEKLEVTNELALCSQRARIILLQIKQHGENFDSEVEPDINFSENEPELDSYLPAMDSPTINKKHTIDIRPNVIPIDQEESYFPMEQEDSNSNISAEDQPTNEVEEPTRITINESTNKSAVAEKPGLFGCVGDLAEDGPGPADEDFIKCSECSQTIFKGYMDFHVKTHHGQLMPISSSVVRKPFQRRAGFTREALLDVIECSFCQLKLSSQVMDLHVSLRHTRKTYQKTPEMQEKGLNRLIQCPSCPCMFYPESMQEHIADNHPPKHNPDLEKIRMCSYCGRKIRYCDMDQHIKSNHGVNAWRKCIHCKKRVRNTDTDIEAHLFQEHHGGRLLACIKCDERYAKTGEEQAHMQTFLSCKYKCPLQTCSKTFVTSSSFKDHVLFFHPKIEEELQDEINREIYEIFRVDKDTDKIQDEEKSEDVDIQIEEISDQKNIPPEKPLPMFGTRRNNYGGPVKCDICENLVRHKWYLIKHKNKVHNMNLTYDCVECGKKYPTVDKIFNHLKGMHVEKNKVCDICGKAFTKARYWAHMKWHERFPNGPPQRNFLDRPLDPVRCGMCNRPARSKYALLTHINAEHLDVVKERLPFHCEPCDREFANFEYLMQHNYSKHLPKIVCTYCGKLITQNRMSMHLKIHEPDRGSDYKGKKRGRKPSKAVK